VKVDLSSFHLSSWTTKAFFAAISLLLIILISGFIFSSKDVTIKVDGRTKHLLSRAETVGELLAEQKIKISDHDEIKPSPESSVEHGMTIAVSRAFPVVIEVNGKSRELFTVAETVGQTVESLGIDPLADIKLDPAPETHVSAGMTIRVELLNRWIEKVQTEIPYETKREDDNGLAKGRTRVATKGRPGIKETVIEHVMAGGREVERIVQSEQTIAEPTVEIVKVGTSVPRSPTTGAGPGIEVSRGDRSLVMSATAYAGGTGGAGWRTATGTGVYKGIVAVDPRVIPLGTKLYIDGYGPAIAADTGGAIKGNRIDLAFGSREEAIQFGRRTVTVHFAN
jgi:resuscitation-promoting factor RpfB